MYAATVPLVIEVEAGDPVVICYGETLQLGQLGATIMGDVSDGLWFSSGDGIFLPGGQGNGIFSTTTQYQPGQQDQSNGSFTLILVSDDPDDTGPMTEVSDQVVISFMSAPPLACNNSINVSLSEGCEQQVDVTMLLANPIMPYNKYDIALFDDQGDLIPNALLTVEHINMEITFQVTHDCTSSSCGGDITVTDNIAPFLNCTQVEVDCEDGVTPENAGFPIPFYASATPDGDNTYSVTNFDDCGEVSLTYTDIEQELECAPTGFIKRITRTWTATDPSGNSSICQQVIMVRPLALSDVLLPTNYDGTANPALSCSGSWIPLANGNPSPETTGSPSFEDCGNIATSYSDVLFEECGAGFKVLRQWVIVDWCTTTTINHNQIIKILDQEGPVFTCPSDMTINAQAYECISVDHTLLFDEDVQDCSDYSASYMIINALDQDVTNLYVQGDMLRDLPVGTYTLTYILTDVCGNSSDCQTSLTVEDTAAPFAVCDGFTQVAVGSNGMADLFATSVDDGSFDNCGDITMEVAKMTDACGWGLAYGPKVRFCCEEIGDTVMVAYRVTDEQGLTNTCMVTAFVEDKLPPVISCPSNLTISCSYDFDQLDLSVFGEVTEGTSSAGDIIIDGFVVGSGGYFYDNCGATVEEDPIIDLDCGSGTITRNFTAIDLYGEIAVCTQTITIINDSPFLLDDIDWPSNFLTTGCDTIQASPLVTGEPILSSAKCAMAASTYDDQVFFISGGACVKILREWTVIDWCQYDPTTGQGLWTYLQEIKLKNEVDPIFLNCGDQEVCTYDEDCTSGEVVLAAVAEDDCTDSLEILYLWELDIDDDGSIDELGEGQSITRDLNIGMHRIFWIAEDRCGNQARCDYAVEVRDCKNPTPYCNSSITTTIMPSSGAIDIWAEDFDYGSTDNCTAAEDLIFSFSPDITDDRRVITCDSIENGVAQAFTYNLYVTDEYGNQERCTVTFIVQDNADGCEDGTIKGKIIGSVKTEDGKSLEDAEIDVVASIDTFSGFDLTDADGRFAYGETPELLKYVLRPHYNSSPELGVTTLDIVMIQRHILGLSRFDNPYDIIASDVNGNEKVNSSDLLTLRKMVLGIITEWPNEMHNWTFVDSTFVFEDEEDPYLYPDSIVIDRLMDTTRAANFISIKIGDVNSSYSGFQSEQILAESRSTRAIDLHATSEKSDAAFISNLSLPDRYDTVDGLQMSILVPNDVIISSSYLSESDYVVDRGILKISWANANPDQVVTGPLLSLITDQETSILLSNDIHPEIYIDMEAHTLGIEPEGEEIIEQIGTSLSLEVLNNPFVHDLVLRNTSDQSVALQIYDVNGIAVCTRRDLTQEMISVPASHFTVGGVYIVRYQIGDGVMQSLKVIKG